MAGGIWGEGPRGGIFGAPIDPALLRELEKRAALERERQTQASAQSGGGGWGEKRPPNLARRILAAPSKLFGGLVVDPAVEGITDLVTLAGDVQRGEQPTMSMDPQTGEMHTDPRLIKRTANAAGTLTLGAGAIPAEVNALRMGIKAYHGSPHDFDQFSMDKIGTGEGAQAYGHGIYLAESPGVAESYRRAGPAGNMPAPAYEAPSDVLASNAEQFGELTVSSPLLVKGFGALDVEGRSRVLPVMRGLLNDPEIGKAVVRLLPVDVVNMLGGKQLSREMLLHDPSMLVNLLPANADHAVAGGVEAVDVLAPYVARATAKRPLIGPQLAAKLEEGLAARSASKGDLHVRSEVAYPSGKGNMYEVDIAAEPEQFLDWDKPLVEQSPQVQQAALGTAQPPDPGALRKRAETATGAEKEFLLNQADYLENQLSMKGEGWHGSAVAENLPSEWDDFEAARRIARAKVAEQLRERGASGIRYLDQGSRVNLANLPKNPMTDEARKWLEAHGNDPDAAVKAFHQHQRDTGYKDWNTTERDEIANVIRKSVQPSTRNYVIFPGNEHLISILRKYGLPISAAGLAALSQLHPEEAQAAQQKQKGR